MRRVFVLSYLTHIIAIVLFLLVTGCTKDETEESTSRKTQPTRISNMASQKATRSGGKPENTLDKFDQAAKNSRKESEISAPSVAKPETDSGNNAKFAEIVLFSSLWESPTKGPVRFTHENHLTTHKINCSECHHVYEKGENIWNENTAVEKCEKCHNDSTIKSEKDLPPDIQKKNLKLAFHNNCRGCHKKIKKENPETTAPTTCSKCHEKKQ